MNTTRQCPQCGSELPPNAPEGQCPKCLLEVGIGSQAPTSDGSPAPPRPTPPLPADLAPHFPQLEIHELLGQGGMGMVYKARQPRLDRWVALKILPAEAARDPAFAERFTREARALARLSHPNIVAVHDFGEAGGFYYLVMEFVDGASLRQLERTGDLSPKEALTIVPAICDALQFAHNQGIVHRDIKPENILVDKQGRVKIADFGLAKLLGQPPLEQNLTAAQQVMGTPHYMAPEQVENPQAVDHRADIYSLGVVFYEMLTGELPLGRFAPPSQKVEVDVRLDQVVLRTLEKERERRYQQASEVKTAVETIVARTAPSETPASATRGASVQSAVSLPPGMAEAVEACRSVRGPATGLIVVGILNWVLIPLYAVFGLWLMASHDPLNAKPLVGFCLVLLAVLSSFLIFAGMKMKALEAYRVAIAGSIGAMVVSPGNLIGLPIGIWALVTLTRPAVRQAFRERPPLEAFKAAAPPPSDPTRRWLFVTAAVLLAGVGLAAFLLVAFLVTASVLPALARARHVAQTRAAAESVTALPPAVAVRLKSFATSDPVLSPEATPTPDGAWAIAPREAGSIRLFELPLTNATHCRLFYRAQLKSEGLTGRAYLEMWVRAPGKGEFFSRGLELPVTGDTDWTPSSTLFHLKEGETADRARLNVVVEGQGRVWIKDIELSRTPTP